MRLIDADALITVFKFLCEQKSVDMITLEAVEAVIDKIAEPQIIRCKECKYYQFADNRAFGFPVKRCEWTGFEDVDDDDFCSRAERRENEP